MKYLKIFQKRKTEEKKEKNVKFMLKMQKMGSFLAGMIMPTIGVLIAWGLWTAMFLVDGDGKQLGWFNVPMLGALCEPGIKYLLPILIAFNGGRMVYQLRGGMIATFVILCAIVGSDFIYSNWIWFGTDPLKPHPVSPNQFIGAMVLGPSSALVLKSLEKTYLERINPGFEMLVKNFGIGLLGIAIGLGVFFGWGWIMWGITWVMMAIINLFGDNKWVAPLLGIFTEPVKVSFLNNALNHGVLGPIGYQQIAELTAKGFENPRSIFFLYDPNPGPGLGLLISYMIWHKGEDRTNAMGASLIHTVGGIHEVYFPFILTNPKMVLSSMGGVVSAQFVTSYFGGGTVATPSPGSIISLVALSPGTQAISINLVAFVVGTAVSFGIASGLLLLSRKKNKATNKMTIKFSDEGISFNNDETNKELTNEAANNQLTAGFKWNKIKKIVVACEAGMGSSAMAAGVIRKYVKKNNYPIEVINVSVKDLPDDADVIVTMNNFKSFAKEKNPTAYIYAVDKFIGTGVYDELYKNISSAFLERKED